MKRRLAVLFLFLCLLAYVFMPAAARDAAQAKGLFWEARSERATVYLLGAVHFMKAEIYPLPVKIEEAFHRAEKLVVELDAGKRAAEIQTLTLRYGLYPPGDSLRNHLDADTYETIKKKAGEYGLNMAVVDSFRPWLAATILISLEFEKAGYLAAQGLDLHFLNQAGNKEIVELETAEFQIKLMASLDELILRDSLGDLDRAGEIIARFTAAWLDGDAGAVEELTYEELGDPELAKFYDDFYFARNRAWADRLAGFLQEDGVYFVVVGAGHLVGPRGVVELLRKKGFKITQL
ncbi:MAG: TraB/GumN family protein [Bacillota bacterium]